MWWSSRVLRDRIHVWAWRGTVRTTRRCQPAYYFALLPAAHAFSSSVPHAIREGISQPSLVVNNELVDITILSTEYSTELESDMLQLALARKKLLIWPRLVSCLLYGVPQQSDYLEVGLGADF